MDPDLVVFFCVSGLFFVGAIIGCIYSILDRKKKVKASSPFLTIDSVCPKTPFLYAATLGITYYGKKMIAVLYRNSEGIKMETLTIDGICVKKKDFNNDAGIIEGILLEKIHETDAFPDAPEIALKRLKIAKSTFNTGSNVPDTAISFTRMRVDEELSSDELTVLVGEKDGKRTTG